MKMLRNLRLPTLVAAAAIAGFSLSAAYAVPNYLPATNSPLNAPDGGADLGAGLALINAQLAAGKTLVLPVTNDTPTSVKPTKTEFLTALRAAAAAQATAAGKASVIRAGLFAGSNTAYGYAVTKDAVRGVVTDYLASSPIQADVMVVLDAALSVNNGKAADVMAGLVLAIGDAPNTAFEADTDLYAGDVTDSAFEVGGFDAAGKAAKLVESVAENAIKNAKPNAAGTTGYLGANLAVNMKDTATALMQAVIDSGAKFAIDDAARGISKGFKGLKSANLTTFNDGFTAIAAATGMTHDDKAHAMAGMIRVLFNTDATELAQAKAAFGNDALLNEVVDGYRDISAILTGANDRATAFAAYALANPTKAAHYALGGVYLSPGLTPLFVRDGMSNITATGDKVKMLELLSRAQNGQAAKSAGFAVSNGGLAYTDALSAALPNTLSVFAGSVVKEVAKAATAATAAQLTTAAINTLETAVSAGPEDDFKAGVIDAVSEIMKLRKAPGDFLSILNAGIAAADPNAGTREAVAAALGRGDFKNSHAADLTSAMGLASPAEIDSVLTAERVARNAKFAPKTALDTTLAEIRGASDTSLAAAVLGGGAVNPKLVNVFMVTALREGGVALMTPQKEAILKSAKSVNKKFETDVQLAYDTANLVLANTDALFEIVDHQAVKYSKSIPTVAAAAAAAAPGFGHYVARAAGFRANSASVSKVPLAIIQAVDMNANLNSNPSAIAAIAAGYISGIIDGKPDVAKAGNEAKFLTSAMFALVKASMGVGDVGTIAKGTAPASGAFRSVNIDTGAAPTGANQPEYGSAAAATGATSVLSNVGDSTPSARLVTVLKAAGKAAGKGLHNQATVIAQAAAQAAIFVSGNSGYDVIALATAIYQGQQNSTAALPAVHPIRTAALAGAAEAASMNKGAGAPGVLDYAHFNTNNSPVTDISNF